MKGKIGIILGLVILLTIVTGCLNTEFSTKVNKDFSGTRSVNMEISKVFWDFMPPSTKEEYREDIKRNLSGELISYDEKVEGDWVIIKAQAKINDLRQIPNIRISKVDNKIRFEEKYSSISTRATPTSTPKPTITEPELTTFNVGETASDGVTKITLNGVRRIYTINEKKLLIAQYGKEYVILDITLEIIKKGEKRNYPQGSSFQVRDSEGYIYTNHINEYEAMGRPLASAQNLTYGDMIRGELAFEVPTDAKGLKLYFKFDPDNRAIFRIDARPEPTPLPTPEKEETPLENSIKDAFKVTYKVEMPGKITNSNANNFTENTATWYFDASSGEKTMWVESEMPAMPGFTLIFTLIVIAISTIVISRKKIGIRTKNKLQ